jgi:hypothetical protein
VTVIVQKKITLAPSGPSDNTQVHHNSSASQVTTPQYLHVISSNGPIHLNAWKLVAGVWSIVGSFRFDSPASPGIPVGGYNAPMNFQLSNSDVCTFQVTDQP